MSSDQSNQQPMGSIRQRLVRGGLWVAIGRCSGIALMLIANMFLARALSTNDFGFFIVVITLLQLFTTAARCGLDRILVRFITENQTQKNFSGLQATLASAMRLGAVTLTIAMLACALLLAFYGSDSFGLPDSLTNTVLILLGLAALTISQLSAEVLRGFHNLRLTSVFDGLTGSVLVYALFIVFLVISHFFGGSSLTFQNALVLYVTALAVPTPVAVIAAWRTFSGHSADANEYQPPSASQVTLRRVVSIGLPIMFAEFCMHAFSQGDILLSACFLGEEQTALYGASKRLMQIVILPLKLTSLAILSTIPELYSERRLNELQMVLRTSATFAALAALCILVPLMIFPGDVMSLVFGESYREAAKIVMILAFGQLIFALSGTSGLSLTVTGHHKSVLMVNMASLVSLLATAPLVTTHFGMTGLACVASLHNAVRNIVMVILARRLLGVWGHADPRKLGALLSLRNKLLQTE